MNKQNIIDSYYDGPIETRNITETELDKEIQEEKEKSDSLNSWDEAY